MTVQLGSLDTSAMPVIVTRWSLASPAQVVLEVDGQIVNCDTGWTAGELRCPLPLSPPPGELRLRVLPAPAGFPPGPYQPTLSLSEEKCTQEVEVCGL